MRVAILHQAIDPPIINGVRKPKKSGGMLSIVMAQALPTDQPLGYQDSGADIAYVLREQCKIPIATPQNHPDPAQHEGWCYSDTKEGILAAIEAGATHLWANTILFANHPLQISKRLDQYASNLSIVGQPPRLVEAYDDKNYVNDLLRNRRIATMPKACLAPNANDLGTLPKDHDMNLPVVAKPIRGRGSQGVKLCRTLADLSTHVESLGPNNTIIEEYLSGTEGTVTIMPPSPSKPSYWPLPFVIRFNHQDGIAPYNGTVAITSNSKAIDSTTASRSPAIMQALAECTAVAEFLKVTAPIRIDVRQRTQDEESPYVLFDVNMKPNMTAPGRPGRDDQASLTALAAAEAGHDPKELLRMILGSARSLAELRGIELPRWY